MLPIGYRAGTILLVIAYGVLAVLYVVVAGKGSSSSSASPASDAT